MLDVQSLQLTSNADRSHYNPKVRDIRADDIIVKSYAKRAARFESRLFWNRKRDK